MSLFLTLVTLIALSFAQSDSVSDSSDESKSPPRRYRKPTTSTTTTTTTTTSPPPNPNAAIPAKHYKDGLWIAQGPAYNSFFMCTGNGVVVMDAPAGWGDRLVPTIQNACGPNEPITHLVYSHHHSDHIGGAPAYKALNPNLTIVCQEIVNQKVVLNWGFNALGPKPPCTQTFYNQMSLSVGNQSVSLEYLGPAHSPGNTFIYAARQKVLMYIDVIFTDYLPFRSLAIAEDIPAFGDAHKWILDYFDFDVLVSGHVGRTATRADVQLGLQFFNDLKMAAGQALATVNFNQIAAQVGSTDRWVIAKAWESAVRDECVKTMTVKWGSKLGATYLPSQCLAMQTAVRVE